MNKDLSIFVCPECGKKIEIDKDNQLVCSQHGIVGKKHFGVWDFLVGKTTMPVAADGEFDLTEDAGKAQIVIDNFDDTDFVGLQRILADIDMASLKSGPLEAKAIKRFNKNYAKMDAEIGLEAGQSIINKVNPHLINKGLRPLQGELALEAGGGHGLHLPVFARHFERVVFLDCSLVNLTMGKKLAQENGLADSVLLVRGDATHLPFESNTFDFVHEAGVIEHVENPGELVSEALRVLSDKGNYVCLSPNKYPLSPEPHFRLPLFGIFPKKIRPYILSVTRGISSEAGTDLRSLRELKDYFYSAGEKDIDPYFLPRELASTTRKSFLRSIIHKCLHLPGIGRSVDFILNDLLLFVMPYHIVVISRQSK